MVVKLELDTENVELAEALPKKPPLAKTDTEFPFCRWLPTGIELLLLADRWDALATKGVAAAHVAVTAWAVVVPMQFVATSRAMWNAMWFISGKLAAASCVTRMLGLSHFLPHLGAKSCGLMLVA